MPSTSGMREDANTSEEQQRQQQQESSPLPLKPGPRASRLQDVYEKALLATLKANSYDNFAACFPTPARHVPASLASVHRQLNAKLEESAKSEFAEILRERDVVRKLNDLDRLVGEARMRKQKAEEEGNGEGDPPYVQSSIVGFFFFFSFLLTVCMIDRTRWVLMSYIVPISSLICKMRRHR